MSRYLHRLPDGRKVHIEDCGAGFPVIFQHGLGGDLRQVADGFPDGLSCRRITLECRGHGLSGLASGESYSIAGFADDLIAVADALGLARFAIGGISMGAAIALRIAALHPGRVTGLMLIRPAWLAEAAPENMRAFSLVADHLRQSGRNGRAAFLASPTGRRLAHEAPDNLASLAGFFDHPEPAAIAVLLDAIARDGPGVDERQIRALKVPALVVGHGLDLVHPLDYAHRLGEMIPDARVIAITPKAVDRAGYSADLHAALTDFIRYLDTFQETCA